MLGLLLAWDASGLDLPLARWAGTPYGFPRRNDAFLVKVLHEGAKDLCWLLALGLGLAVRWPPRFMRGLGRGERWQLLLTVLASVAVITLLKHGSHTSCPWDLSEFGGTAARSPSVPYVSHWDWFTRDGGPGNCFPAGHASAAFGYLGGWFVWHRRAPRVAALWLVSAVLGGLLLGVVQQLRGAHYMSHTLWTAWLCWTTGFVLDRAFVAWRAVRRRRSIAPQVASLNGS